MDGLLSVVAVALYCFASFQLYLALQSEVAALSPQPATDVSNGRSRLSWKLVAALACAMHLFVAIRLTGFPDELNFPFFTSISVTALAVVVILLTLCLSQPAGYLGLLVFPIAAIALLFGQLQHQTDNGVDLSIKLHVLLSLIAYALLALAAAQAILVAYQRHHLSNHRPTGFIQALPPLQRTEALLFALLGGGFVMLTLALISGWAYLDNMFAQNVAHKTILSCVAWLIFASLLFGRWRFGWRGKRAINWTLGGFVMLLIAYFGSKLVLELILLR